MPKLSIHRASLLVLASLGIALMPAVATAATYGVGGQSDIYHGTVTESVYGFSLSGLLTLPSSVAPSTSYTVSLSGVNLDNSFNIQCYDYSGDSPVCTSGNAAAWVYKNGGQIMYVPSGTGSGTATVTSGASGSDSYSVLMRVAAGSYIDSTWAGGGNSIPSITTSGISVPINVTPTVQINFF